MSVKSVKVCTVYWSGYGHTKRLAEAVHGGVAGEAEVEAHLFDAADFQEKEALVPLDDADAIVFGTPTYMGGPAAAFKGFIDAASGRWLEHRWKDKVAGGFTNSSSPSGDKQGTLIALAVNALQHGMIWVGQGEMPPHPTTPAGSDGEKVNRLGAFMGVMGKSGTGEAGPSEGDLETGRLYGRRIVAVTKQLKAGRGG